MSKQNLQSTAEKSMADSADQISEEQLHTVTGGKLSPTTIDAITAVVSKDEDLKKALAGYLGKKPSEVDSDTIRNVLKNPPPGAGLLLATLMK